MFSVIPELKPGHSGMPALFLLLYSPFTVTCGNMRGGEKEPFERQTFKRFGVLLAAEEV